MPLMQYECVKLVLTTIMLVEQCLLRHMSGCELIGACVLIRMNTVH